MKESFLNDIDNSALIRSRDSIESLIRALEDEEKFKEYVSTRPFLSHLNNMDFAEVDFRELKKNRKAVGVMADGCNADDIMGRLVCEADFQSAVSNADFVIEAVPEILSVKQEIFRKLGEYTQSHTVCASNTGSLLVSKIGQLSRRPEKVIGMHHHGFATPFNALVEIMGSSKTAGESLEAGKSVGESFPNVTGKRMVVRLEKGRLGFYSKQAHVSGKFFQGLSP